MLLLVMSPLVGCSLFRSKPEGPPPPPMARVVAQAVLPSVPAPAAAAAPNALAGTIPAMPSTGWLVLDFPHARTMTLEGSRTEVRNWLAATFDKVTFADVARTAGSKPAEPHVPVALEEQPARSAVLGLTAPRTLFPASYSGRGTKEDEPEELEEGLELTGRTLVFADHKFAPVTIIAQEGDPEPVLGRDVLSQVIVVMPADAKEPLLVGVP